MEENSIKNKKLLCLLLSVVMTASVLTGCTTKNNASEEETETTEESLNTEEHEPLTLIDSGQDYGELIDFVHEKYPEIQFQIEGYLEQDQSRYFYRQLEADQMPDIYTTTYAWDGELQNI